MKKISLMALITMAMLAKGSNYGQQTLPLIVITNVDDNKIEEVSMEKRLLWRNLHSAIASDDIASTQHSFTLLERFYGENCEEMLYCFRLWEDSLANDRGLSPLAHALSLGANPEIISLLVESGAPVDLGRKLDDSMLLDILLRESISQMRLKHAGKSEQEIVEIIGKYITSVSDILDKSLCVQAVSQKNSEAIAALGKYAPNLINKSDRYFGTPLQAAIYLEGGGRSYLEIVNLLLDNGATHSINVSHQAQYELSPLFRAVYNNQLGRVRLLLANGAAGSMNQLERNGITSLSCAVQGDNLEMVKLLLDHSARVDIADAQYGNTVLHRAVSNIRNENTTPIIKLLLAHGANPLKKNSRGKTALDLCTNPKDRQLLLESQARK